MKRNKRIIVMAHCLLNPDSKVQGFASFGGVLKEVVMPFIKAHVGIMQLPCPECTFLGMRRWGMTREQYDIIPYRRHCRNLLEPLVFQIGEALKVKDRVLGVLGVEGSPSCGIATTCFGYVGGTAEAMDSQKSSMAPGKGVYMEVLETMLREEGITLPFRGVLEAEPDLEALEKLLE